MDPVTSIVLISLRVEFKFLAVNKNPWKAELIMARSMSRFCSARVDIPFSILTVFIIFHFISVYGKSAVFDTRTFLNSQR